MPGPDLPPPHEPITAAVYLNRWPSAVVRAEFLHGVLLFYGDFDERDIAIAQRTYPGRRVLLNADCGLEVHPADGQLLPLVGHS
ncbi:hypothetical protein [Streptomyces humi]